MSDRDNLTTAPKTYQGKEEWGTLPESDRAWHQRRHNLIEQGRANGGRIFLNGRQ